MRDCLLSRMKSSYSSRRGAVTWCSSYAVASLDLGERKQKVCGLSPGVRHTSPSLRCRLRIADIPTIYFFVLRRVRKISSICPSVSTEKLVFRCTAFCGTSLTETCQYCPLSVKIRQKSQALYMKNNVHLWHSSFEWRQRAMRYELKPKKQLTKKHANWDCVLMWDELRPKK
jgi:hypothetical protein